VAFGSLPLSSHHYPDLLEGKVLYGVPDPNRSELGNEFPPFGVPNPKARPSIWGQALGKGSYYYGGRLPFHQTFPGGMTPTIHPEDPTSIQSREQIRGAYRGREKVQHECHRSQLLPQIAWCPLLI